ncbi:MAG: phosphotransferase [Micropruina sp.]|uniref:phosphotransferase enzyme family protein n=1 Tax=Micropruina sp. TaxID=2737536 RepID=UPI0039E42071
MSPADEPAEPGEVMLVGGTANRGRVVRRGAAVHRPPGPNSAAVHALLDHLRRVGFDGAPRFLGIDGRGREVLDFVPGDTVVRPHAPWMFGDDALRSMARLLRRYHQAASGFDVTPWRWSRPPPEPFRGPLACHSDLNPANVVFRDGRAVALIDFDLVGPGLPVWDVAAAARLWAPLKPDEYIADSRRGRTAERLGIFLRAYGGDFDPEQFVDAVAANHDWLYQVVEDGSEAGNPGFVDYWGRIEPQVAELRAWYQDRRGELVTAATAGLSR